MDVTNTYKLDFDNLEKYKAALDDGFTWGDTGFESQNKAITLQASNNIYFLTTVNLLDGSFSVLIAEENFKIFSEKVKLFFSKNIN